MKQPARYSVRAAILALSVSLALSACASMIVGKSKMLPVTGEVQTLTLKFWRIEFKTAADGDLLIVSGHATPRRDKLPAWAGRIDSFKLTAYLCDAHGSVLASGETAVTPRDVDAASSAPFAFNFKKETKAAAVAFGYQTRITAKDPAPGDAREFFANEAALIRY